MDRVYRIIRMIALFDLYGPLLSTTQQEILESYLGYDLSLSEIAEARHISRAAVEDAVQKGYKKLEEYESLLHERENREKVYKIIAKLKEKGLKEEEKLDLLEEIERII